MSTSELKETKLNLIDWINQLSDEDLITFLDGLRMSRTKMDGLEEYSSEQRKQVIAGLKDSDEGKVVDSTEFWKKLRDD